MKDLLWQYYFYVEAEGNIDTPDGEAMMLELRDFCDRLKAVGTFVKRQQ
jgi:chorismate mutase/prephenate dehydratase